MGDGSKAELTVKGGMRRRGRTGVYVSFGYSEVGGGGGGGGGVRYNAKTGEGTWAMFKLMGF